MYNIDRLSPAFFKRVREDRQYDFLVEKIKEVYAEFSETPIRILPFSKRKMFVENGDRMEFENLYFARRKFLHSAALLALIYPEETQYLETTEDLIAAICEEYCWAVPAHCDNTVAGEDDFIDLFASETARSLAELDRVFGDRLDAKLREILRREIHNRVFHGYVNRSFFWMTADTNWSAVCPCNVATAMMLLEPDLFEQCLPSVLKTVEGFLSGFPESGLCMEGPSYWSYGFSAFAYFADDLATYTDGRIDLFANEKVKNIAGYMQTTLLRGGASVSFADAYRHFAFYFGLQYLLHRRYPDTVVLFDPKYLTTESNDFWQLFSRSLLYFDPTEPIPETADTAYFYEDACQYFCTNDTYSFACKGGYNNELHNHQDIGSFIISTDDGQILCDLGAGKYTKQYFSPDRYSIFCCGSQGHSVPIIDGNYQRGFRAGADTVHLNQNGNRISMEYSVAYNLDIPRLEREFILNKTGILLTDRVDYDFDSFVDRFVSLKEPTLGKNTVTLPGITMKFDDTLATVSVTKCSHLMHFEEIPVWCIDFSFRKQTREFTVDIVIHQ